MTTQQDQFFESVQCKRGTFIVAAISTISSNKWTTLNLI